MEKTKKEPISIESYLEGLETLYDPSGDTTLTCSLNLDEEYLKPGQLDWIKIHLPDWTALLNEKSGGRVVSIKLKRSKRPGSRPWGDSENGKIVLKILFPGKILPAENQHLAKIMSCGIKRDLAVRIGKEFPPPFGYGMHTCLYPAGFVDTFWIWDHYNHFREVSTITSSKKESFVKEATQIIREAGGEFADIMLDEKAEPTSCLRMRWTRDVSPKERTKLAGRLSDALCSVFGRNCSVNEYI